MNTSVILATNTQVIIERHPRVIVTRASFKMRRVSPDAICRMNFGDGSLLGSPAMISG
jgi:hypothetical protein